MMQDYVKTLSEPERDQRKFQAVVEKHMKPVLDLEGNHTHRLVLSRLDVFE